MTDLAREVAEGLGWEWDDLFDRPRCHLVGWKTDWRCAEFVLEEMRKRGFSVHIDDSPYIDDEYKWRCMFGSFWADGPDLPTAIFRAAKEALK